MSIEEIGNKLIELYLCVKVRKSDDIHNMTPESINQEKKKFKKNSIIRYNKLHSKFFRYFNRNEITRKI